MTLPSSQSELMRWLANFRLQVGADGAAYGLTPAQQALLENNSVAWTAAMNNLPLREAEYHLACKMQSSTRKELLATTKELVRVLQGNPNMTDVVRQQFGLNIPSESHASVPAPATQPRGLLLASEKLRHVLKVVDADSPASQGRPQGVMACEVWMNIAAPDAVPVVDPKDMMLAAVHRNHQYTHGFPGTQAGKVAHYLFRWINARGAAGPWSDPLAVTIAA